MNADKPPMAWRPPVDHENARSAAHLRMSIGFGRIHHLKDIYVFSEQRRSKTKKLSVLLIYQFVSRRDDFHHAAFAFIWLRVAFRAARIAGRIFRPRSVMW
jgi:hypothetical protein